MQFKFSTLSLIGLALTGACLPLTAQSALEDAQAKAEAKLEDAIARLGAVKSEIRQEKLPVAQERQTLLDELKEIRREADRMARVRDNSRTDVAQLENNVAARQQEIDYLRNLSAEYIRTFESRADAAELPLYSELTSEAQAVVDNPDLSDLEKMTAQMAVIDAAIARADKLIGGTTFSGQAVVPGGEFAQGTFALVGPIAYFASNDGQYASVSIGSSTTLRPTLINVEDGAFTADIAGLVQSGSGSIPLDPTLGNAQAIASVKESVGEHISKGGVWIYPILGFAALSMIIALFKLYELLSLPKAKAGTLANILEALQNGEKEQAVRLANETPGPMGKLLQQGVRFHDSDPELLEEMLYENIVETQPKVMRLLPFISVTAAVSPLLGLLGTVTGMINTFNMIKIFGTGDAKSLSGGISEALITTEFGLIVAIPSLLFYAFLSRMAKGYLGRMESMSISFLNGIKALRFKQVA